MARWLALLTLTIARLLGQGTPGAPVYSAAGIANSAANVAGYYAPNSFLSIYGQNLSYVVKPISPDDIHSGTLPITLTGTGVGVLINMIPADMYYVSPNQVNVLIPPSLVAGPATVQLQNDGIYGPPVPIMLSAAAPVLFQLDAVNVLATHGNWPVVTPQSPARPGEIVVLWATGLGLTTPEAIPNQIPDFAAWIVDRADFHVTLNGVDVDPRRIFYAGVTPGYAGLFQINLQLPPDCPPNPEIRIGYGSALSPAGRILLVKSSA